MDYVCSNIGGHAMDGGGGRVLTILGPGGGGGEVKEEEGRSRGKEMRCGRLVWRGGIYRIIGTLE